MSRLFVEKVRGRGCQYFRVSGEWIVGMDDARVLLWERAIFICVDVNRNVI